MRTVLVEFKCAFGADFQIVKAVGEDGLKSMYLTHDGEDARDLVYRSEMSDAELLEIAQKLVERYQDPNDLSRYFE